MHVYTEAWSIPNACRYPIHAFGTLRASVYMCIIEIYVKILTATVVRMRVVTLFPFGGGSGRRGERERRQEAEGGLTLYVNTP